MSVNLNGDNVEVWKFASSGLIALAQEVSDPETIEVLRRHDCDLDTARFYETDGIIGFRFNVVKEDPRVRYARTALGIVREDGHVRRKTLSDLLAAYDELRKEKEQ